MVSQLLELNQAIADPITPKLLPKSYKLQYGLYYIINYIIIYNYLLKYFFIYSKIQQSRRYKGHNKNAKKSFFYYSRMFPAIKKVSLVFY